MKLKFLGTGAADWHGPDERGEFRRFTSTLLDGRLLIDVTQTVLDQIPDQANITDAGNVPSPWRRNAELSG